MLPFTLRVISFLTLTTTMALAIPLSKPGCPEKCGNVSIPYPYGIGSQCSFNSSFTVICQNSSKPFLSGIKMEVVHISLFGAVIVNQAVSPLNCSDEQTTGSLPISLEGTPFTISAHYNALAVLGCENSVWYRANKTTVGGCTAICDGDSTDTSCNGVNCCQTTIPTRLKELNYTYKSINQGNNNSFCGYVFPVDKKWLQNEDYKRYRGLVSNLSNPFDPGFGFVPLILEWELGVGQNFSNTICKNPDDFHFSYTYDYRRMYLNLCREYVPFFFLDSRYPDEFCTRNPDDHRCQSLLDNYEHEYHYTFYYSASDYVSSTKYCSCDLGFEGNPYLPEGCSDIDECSNATLSNCPDGQTCINRDGSFFCGNGYGGVVDGRYDERKNDRTRLIIKITSIIIGSVVGALVLVIMAWKSTKAITKLIIATRKYMFFKRNGGLLLEQHLSATENGLQKTKLFTSNELAKATDQYNENRILGRGGQGTVYKGMLTDGMIVAVKKSKKVEEGDVEVFINEVVILSQINHRNIVKLLGCCLETEIPLLVYEFISNGTLFQHVHDPNEEFPLSWQMRVRIAREIAGALAYLHSSSSAPIYHRDIKSTNILLDDKYRARISDFGMSRSVSIDQTHLTTRVIGTFGYFDPEYFQSSQFTDKSDVYSFGVVMVELLTGEKAVSSIRAEAGKSLAIHFLHSMEENQLFDILDPRVLHEGKEEEIIAIAELARRCLHLNGRRRPTMKEVAVELEGIQKLKESSSFLQNQDDNIECNSIEGVESDDFSSISGSMHSDEPPLLDEP